MFWSWVFYPLDKMCFEKVGSLYKDQINDDQNRRIDIRVLTLSQTQWWSNFYCIRHNTCAYSAVLIGPVAMPVFLRPELLTTTEGATFTRAVRQLRRHWICGYVMHAQHETGSSRSWVTWRSCACTRSMQKHSPVVSHSKRTQLIYSDAKERGSREPGTASSAQ